MDIYDLEKISENEKCIFFLEKGLTKYIQEDDSTNGNKGLKGRKVVVVELKEDKSRSILMFNNNNTIINECSGYENACVCIDLLKFGNM